MTDAWGCIFLPPAKAREIYARASKLTGVPLSVMNSKTRTAEASHARWLAMHEMRRLRASLPQIALRTGKDHTTVLHGLRAISYKIERESYWAELAERMTR